VIGKRSKAAREGLDHVRFLSRLAELELIDRERRMVESRIRAPPSVRRLRKLAACVFRRRRVSTGSASPPFRRATSRSFSNRGSRIWRRPRQYYCSGLLLWVIPAPARPTPVWRSASRPVPFGELRSGVPVSVFTAAGLVHQLREARERLLKLQVQLAAVKRLIIDERGYVPLLSSSKGTDRRGNAFRDLPPAS
jgi:hypothetical protein